MCSRSRNLWCIITYSIKWVTASWTRSNIFISKTYHSLYYRTVNYCHFKPCVLTLHSFSFSGKFFLRIWFLPVTTDIWFNFHFGQNIWTRKKYWWNTFFYNSKVKKIVTIKQLSFMVLKLRKVFSKKRWFINMPNCEIFLLGIKN